MQTAPYFPGIPRRMGRALSAWVKRDGFSVHKGKLLRLSDMERRQLREPGLLPLDCRDGAIFAAADQSARRCYLEASRLGTVDAILDAIRQECAYRGVNEPDGEQPDEQIKRALDPGWWVRHIRTQHARRTEHAAIQLGFTSYRTGPYISDEGAIRQAKRNRDNEKLLAASYVQNEHGQEYSLLELAAFGMANKALRRGELMTRIRGFEEIAQDLKHVGLFWTITAPSKYHAVINKSGKENPKYLAFNCPTPRDAQKYLVGVWKCIRSALHRRGIQPYGFRIAEPHHDGCPHWHMLLFVAPQHVEKMNEIILKYALLEDAGEWANEDNRAKLVRIEAGKGTAAGYIAKYVSKNIDGFAVGEHHVKEDGKSYVVQTDLIDHQEITPSQRVTYWSQTWGIRQFQQIGGAPVGVWRELRRVREERIANAAAEIQAAWHAVQSVKQVITEIIDGKKVKQTITLKQASWADYLRAQGGATVGRKGAIQLEKKDVEVVGRYATYTGKKPCGVYPLVNRKALVESVRYQWRKSGGVAFDVPRTGVNNCTVDLSSLSQKMAASTAQAVRESEKNEFSAPPVVDWAEIKQSAKAEQRATAFKEMRMNRESKEPEIKRQRLDSGGRIVLPWDTGRRYDAAGKLIN